jgi:penicillin amidase
MPYSLAFLFALTLAFAGCSETGSAGGSGGTGGVGGTGGTPDLEWPPEATAYFDEYGILSADCATDTDCAMVLGYFHATDRFVQMDFHRRVVTGRLTDIFDKDFGQFLGLADLSAERRAVLSTREGRPIEEQFIEQSSEETQTMLEAYAAGVNQWIAHVQNGSNGAVFPREFANPPFVYSAEQIPEWTVEDSAAVGLLLVDTLTRGASFDVNAGIAREEIGDDDKFADIWSLRPQVESSILAPGWQPPATSASAALAPKEASTSKGLESRPALRRLSARTVRNAKVLGTVSGSSAPSPGTGSNSWVLGPSRTANGNALLASDMHLPASQPATLYVTHLDAKTHGSGAIHVAGVTVPGLPFVITGHNERIAWGPTNTYLDFTDFYIEELVKDPDGRAVGVMFQGEMVPFTRVPFTATYSDGSEEQRELLFVPHHGPVREIDLANNVAMTVRWTGQDAGTDLNQFIPLAKAETVEQGRVANESATAWGACYVMADVEGTIGYFPYNRPAKRDWATNLDGDAPPWVPLDGRCETPERCYEWTEVWGPADLPQVVNPPEGFIATANNDITGSLFDGDPTNDGYPPLQTEPWTSFRHARIVELIEESGSTHTRETMSRIQGDTHSLIGELMTPGFIDIAESEETTLTAQGQKLLAALKAWQFTCPTGLDGPLQSSPLTTDANELREASGCAAFHAAAFVADDNCRPLGMREDYMFRAPGYRFEPSHAFFRSVVAPSQLLAGDVYWDDPATPETETKYQVIGECFDGAARYLIDEVGLGDDETKWPWGRVRGLVLRSDLHQLGISQYNNPPPQQSAFAKDGGYETVNPSSASLDARHGFVVAPLAAERMICEISPAGPECTIQLPGGQSSHIDSPNYDDLLFKHLDNEPIDLVFDIEEAKANAVRTVTFE